MTTYRQQLKTAEEAMKWAEAHPDGMLENADGLQTFASPNFEALYPPYTVINTGNTITIGDIRYREGDVVSDVQLMFIGCIFEIVSAPHGLSQWKILHIPDEVANKPAPKEPKTLTLEEACNRRQSSCVFYISPVSGEVDARQVGGLEFYYLFKAHVDNGGHLFATREDAELGKSRGMK